MTNELKIYVADLAAYNNGKLHGVWIDAMSELDDMQDQINVMLKASPEGFAEEWAIHDYDGFSGVSLSEYESLETVHEVACFLNDYPDIGAELYNHYSNLDEAKSAAEDKYFGCYDSVAGYAQDVTEETTDIPQHLQYYIDYEKLGRDMEMNGEIFTIEVAHDKLYVFCGY